LTFPYRDGKVIVISKAAGGKDMSDTMDQKINRINELARKAKTQGLTDEEIDERNELRQAYIQAFRGSLKGQLDNIKFVDEEEK
jgi:uncharacterized protein YnzC (UPF0291/DUF896 family)